jgi:Holliday junction DNA helicase RuvB
MEKPADMISVLNQLEPGDILFIDEIHRLKPKIEEILYIAMEDFRVDIIMQDESMSLPINKFTLI